MTDLDSSALRRDDPPELQAARHRMVERQLRARDITDERVLSAMTDFYARTLTVVLRHSWLMLVVMIATVALTVQMFRSAPKGYFPQDDTGLIVGFTQASTDISFPAMAQLQQQGAAILAADPAVFGVASNIGGGSGSVNTGRFFVSLKPLEERGLSSAQVVARLRV